MSTEYNEFDLRAERLKPVRSSSDGKVEHFSRQVRVTACKISIDIHLIILGTSRVDTTEYGQTPYTSRVTICEFHNMECSIFPTLEEAIFVEI